MLRRCARSWNANSSASIFVSGTSVVLDTSVAIAVLAGQVGTLVRRCRVLEITANTAAVYARLRLGLKSKGKPIPENDLWIAAICVEHQVPLATLDAHFDVVDGLERVRM
jgi:predicted nucleic acid-binding protein